MPGAGGRLTAGEIDRALTLTHDVWEHLFEMAGDTDTGVLEQVFDALGDGSPARLEQRVVATLESRRCDPDRTLRRGVRRLLHGTLAPAA